MKKKSLIVFLILFIGILGCTNKSALKFKKDYESLNGVKNKLGKENRTVSIDEDNPFEQIKLSEVIKKIDNKESFYVYFGDKLCPWCRSVIEKSIEIAKKNKIKKIYYVAIWDDDGNEIVRDKYELVDGEIKKTVEGDKYYSKLLTLFDEYLADYTLTNSEGNKVNVGEKRIYAPNYIYVEKGLPKKLITGISSLQTNSREELTEEILKEEEQLFDNFFKNNKKS